jgi:hypothetical protein
MRHAAAAHPTFSESVSSACSGTTTRALSARAAMRKTCHAGVSLALQWLAGPRAAHHLGQFSAGTSHTKHLWTTTTTRTTAPEEA